MNNDPLYISYPLSYYYGNIKFEFNNLSLYMTNDTERKQSSKVCIILLVIQ